MKQALLRPAIFLGVLALAVLASAEVDPLGVWVNRDRLSQRIEFLGNGECVIIDCCDPEPGKYAVESDGYLCWRLDSPDSKFLLRIQDDTLVDPDGERWVRRDDYLKFPWTNATPVVFKVVDAETEKPITKFSYDYNIETPETRYDPLLMRPVPVESADGTFTLLAPPSCEIGLVVTAEDVLAGYGSWRSFHIRSDDTNRTVTVHLQKGTTVKGRVVDEATGQPVAGARVSPIIFMPPLFTADPDRFRETDREGRFALHGVDASLGINVTHPDYLEFGRGGFEGIDDSIKTNLPTLEIKLKAGEVLSGVVMDPANRPLAGVEISDGSGKETVSGPDGSFRINSPAKWNADAFYFSFEKSGFINQTIQPATLSNTPVRIVLQPVPILSGQVFDAGHRPVSNYTVFGGCGLEPEDWACSSVAVTNAEGRFALPIETSSWQETNRIWVAVQAAGYAPWDTIVTGADFARPLAVTLQPGVNVSGVVRVPTNHPGRVSVKLIPKKLHKDDPYDRDFSRRQSLGVVASPSDEQGRFTLERVRPDHYTLAVFGKGVTPVNRDIDVPDPGLALEPVVLQGVGVVYGRVYKPADWDGGIWAFADGEIYFRDPAGPWHEEAFDYMKPISFKADEQGRFRVEDVPVGTVSVHISYNATADIIDAITREARVLENRETEVIIRDPAGEHNVVFEFVIGDGSPGQFQSGTGLGAERKTENVNTRDPMFRIELTPLDEKPMDFPSSDWEELDDGHRITVKDVLPGRYGLVIRDWLCSIGTLQGVLVDRELVVEDYKEPVRITLGAGCITGKFKGGYIELLTEGMNHGGIFHAVSDGEGNFCLRYLPEDDYKIEAFDLEAGRWVSETVTVKNATVDLGEPDLQPNQAKDLAPPVRLIEADHPHAAPFVCDFDGDGDQDLLVGQFGLNQRGEASGSYQPLEPPRMRVYRNEGSNADPIFGAGAWFMADGQPATVPEFCVTGFGPQWVDFNGDGKPEIISSAPKSELHVFDNLGDGRYAKARIIPFGGDFFSYNARVFACDWDRDGDQDLLASARSQLFLVRNSGSPAHPVLEKAEPLEAEGRPLKEPGAAPYMADWDGDGHDDLVYGRSDGSVCWRRNLAKEGPPVLGPEEMLVASSLLDTRRRACDEPYEPHDRPGRHVRICVTDWNHDGRMDLILGDHASELVVYPEPVDKSSEVTHYVRHGAVWLFRRLPKANP